MRNTLRVRSDAANVQIASIARSASKVRRPATEIDEIAPLAVPPPFECGAAGRSAPTLRVADEVLAVVVTVNVVPVIEQLPAGMLQIAESVGVVVNPLVSRVNVNALPAPPVCEGCDGVTAAAVANVAVAVVFALIENVQAAFVLPAQAPAQFTNVAPEFGTAVSVIEVPEANEVPLGDCVIVPGPLAFVASV